MAHKKREDYGLTTAEQSVYASHNDERGIDLTVLLKMILDGNVSAENLTSRLKAAGEILLEADKADDLIMVIAALTDIECLGEVTIDWIMENVKPPPEADWPSRQAIMNNYHNRVTELGGWV